MMRRDSEQTLRLFVACELPAEMKAALASLQEALRKKGAPRLRWVRPEGVHLTLKFLGAVPQEKVAAIREALSPTVQGIPPLALSLAEVGTFGDRRGARVVWVGMQGDLEPLARLQQRVEKALEPLGFPPERRAFSPHLPLGCSRCQSQALSMIPSRAGNWGRQPSSRRVFSAEATRDGGSPGRRGSSRTGMG